MTLRKTLYCVVIFAILAAVSWGATSSEMSVQVKKTDVRSSPSFLGNIVASLQYADRVTVGEKNGAWIKVIKNGTSVGWVHSSALTPKVITLTGGNSQKTGASSEEVATSGKGFTEQVEKEYKAQHKDIDFSGVDRMEKLKYPPEQLEKFLKGGGVSSQKGGAQ